MSKKEAVTTITPDQPPATVATMGQQVDSEQHYYCYISEHQGLHRGCGDTEDSYTEARHCSLDSGISGDEAGGGEGEEEERGSSEVSSGGGLEPEAVLKPLYFEVPAPVSGGELRGRGWVEAAILRAGAGGRHVAVSGRPGTGKTAIVLAMVEASCFGRGARDPRSWGAVARRVVAYHFCQADAAASCLVPEFVHSVAAQLAQCPQLAAYRRQLQAPRSPLRHLSLRSCRADPDLALQRGLLQPLRDLGPGGDLCWLLVDGLCEAEQHRPDHGPTLASFLARHLHTFPPWLRLVVTLRTGTSLHLDTDSVSIVRYISSFFAFCSQLRNTIYDTFDFCLCPSLDSEASEDCDEDISEMVALLLEWGVGVDTGTPGTCGTTDHWPVWGL